MIVGRRSEVGSGRHIVSPAHAHLGPIAPHRTRGREGVNDHHAANPRTDVTLLDTMVIVHYVGRHR